ncbi:hypothetical protein ACLKA6_019894 [Drosophila palustris]
MALRCVCSKFPQRKLFNTISKVRVSHKNHGFVRHVSGSTASELSVPWLESPSVVFSVDALNHHWGAWPVVIISAIGFACELIAIARLAATRDDVWYTNGPAPCEVIETRKGYPAPCRKLKVYNQKYVTPKELISTIQINNVDGPPCDIRYDGVNDGKSNESKVSTKLIAAHVIASLGVIYLAFIL